MPLTGVLASCKRCAGHGVTRTVARVSKLVNSKRVQQGLHALRQAGVRAVERLYYAAGALAGVIDGVWRCMRELAGLALGGSMQSPWGSPIRYDTNINLAPATPTDPSCSCSGPGARRALF